MDAYHALLLSSLKGKVPQRWLHLRERTFLRQYTMPHFSDCHGNIHEVEFKLANYPLFTKAGS